jgi:hypothetical protein
MFIRCKDKLSWSEKCRLACIRFVAKSLFRLYVIKELLKDVCHTLWVNAPWFIQEEESLQNTLQQNAIQRVSLGMRLIYKVNPSQKNPHQLYWTDAQQREHRLIVLASPRKSSATFDADRESVSEKENNPVSKLYENASDMCCSSEGFNLSDIELNEWLAGWPLDDQSRGNQSGGSSA